MRPALISDFVVFGHLATEGSLIVVDVGWVRAVYPQALTVVREDKVGALVPSAVLAVDRYRRHSAATDVGCRGAAAYALTHPDAAHTACAGIKLTGGVVWRPSARGMVVSVDDAMHQRATLATVASIAPLTSAQLLHCGRPREHRGPRKTANTAAPEKHRRDSLGACRLRRQILLGSMGRIKPAQSDLRLASLGTLPHRDPPSARCA